jgi:hypothetical protein
MMAPMRQGYRLTRRSAVNRMTSRALARSPMPRTPRRRVLTGARGRRPGRCRSVPRRGDRRRPPRRPGHRATAAHRTPEGHLSGRARRGDRRIPGRRDHHRRTGHRRRLAAGHITAPPRCRRAADRRPAMTRPRRGAVPGCGVSRHAGDDTELLTRLLHLTGVSNRTASHSIAAGSSGKYLARWDA